MAMEPGGRADKFGNEYERLWVVRQILLILQGEVTSVLWEGLGEDERGIDVWVSYSDGTRTGYQCKRQNGSKGKWSVGDLKEVLKNAKFQLGRDSRYKFGFVSSDPAPHLRDLVERTRRCKSDPGQYITYLTTTSSGLQTEFDQICALLGLNKTKLEGQQKAFNFLSRLEVYLFDDSKQGQAELRALARCCVDGDANKVISALENYATQQIGNEVYAKDIQDYLNNTNFQPRNLSGYPQLQRSIETLQARFHKSLNPYLINGKLIKRPEAEETLNKILLGNGSRIVCIHGKAGQGKSGVLYELKERLNEHNLPYLPLRLDRQYPTQSVENFGKTCGLPSSPGVCLKTMASNRKAVLILDQLDAIRWTSTHSADAWDVFEELVEECIDYENLFVVIACRTFDFNEDPRIKAWKGKQSVRIAEVKVGELPEKEVAEIVKDKGINWAQLSKKQKEILKSPANLFLWTQLETVGQLFRTATDLMKAYWDDLWRNKIPNIKVSGQECRDVLETLVEFMDKTGRLTAPDNLVHQLVKAQDALVSLNVLARSDGNIVFSHQGYFDYLVAQRVMDEIHKGKTGVGEWLKVNDQSLFRRDQLRNVLMLLRDEDEKAYYGAIEEIITNQEIRFHLKHLVLSLLGNIDKPLDEEAQFVVRLIEDTKWCEYIKNLVLWNKPQWFKVLYEKEVINKWMCSDNKEQIEFAIRLMSVVLSECEEEIYKIIKPFEKKGGMWSKQVANALGWRFAPTSERKELFAMRIRLMRKGIWIPRFLHWEELSKKNPRRCLLLFRICLSQLVDGYRGLDPNTSEDKLPKLECLGCHDIEAIGEAAKKEPKYAWKSLVRFWLNKWRFISEAMEIFHKYRDYELDEEILDLERKLKLTMVLPIVEKILTSAGEVSGQNYIGEFFENIISTYEQFPNGIKRATMKGLGSLPDEWADKVMLWFSKHPESFKLRRGYYISCWEPAEKIVERFSTICSDEVFEAFEKALMLYREAEIKKNYQRKIEVFKEHNYIRCSENGRTQYVLLSKMPIQRLSQAAINLLGQLERKFARYGLYKAREFQGGSVGSPIPTEKLRLVTDKDWLRIIKKDWSVRRWQWKQMGPNHVGEASHEHFAGDLGHMAELQPQRFARLALRIPRDAYYGYLSRILRAIALTKPPDSLKGAEKDTWQPATGEQIEQILDYMGYLDNPDQAISFCNLIEERVDAKWSLKVLERLILYATKHPDPKPDTFSVQKVNANKQYIPDIVNSALNCVRGRAAITMAKLLFEQRDLFSNFESALKYLVKDVSPPVRVAAMYMCLPILNIDRNKAVAYFLNACDMSDDRILEEPYASRFIAYAWHTHLTSLVPIIERMAHSEIPDVAKNGAAWATVIWLRTGQMTKLKEECCTGNIHQRKGAADVSAHGLSDKSDIEKHVVLLKEFFKDEDLEVRSKASEVFRREERLHIPKIMKLSLCYVETPAFDDEPEELLYGLDDFTGDLKKYAETLFKAGEKLCGPMVNDARNYATSVAVAAHLFGKLMLRLYERTYQDRDKTLHIKCLDTWDKLLEAGIVEHGTLEEIGA